MYAGNPVYYQLPTTPPGIDGLRYLIGGAVAPFVGGVMRPYVPVNQSTFDAGVATYVNDPLYRQMMAGVLGQFGSQLGNTAGAMPFVRGVAGMAGYDPATLQRQMSSGLSTFGRSMLGSMVMPLADSLLANSGLTGGSYVQAAQTLFSNRMAFMNPGTRLNIMDAGQQHQSMANVAATMNLINGLISGNGLMPTQAVTQGFDRNQIATWVTQAAGLGAFTSGGLGVGDRLRAATGGVDRYGLSFDIKDLDSGLGDFTGGGASSNLSNSTAKAVEKIAGETKATIMELTSVMGAVRDLLKTTDGLAEKLTSLTGGTDWGRSAENMRRALSDVRRLDAVFKTYNLDPTQGTAMLQQNRGVLQSAAGFGDEMQMFGFNGGGMFGLEAQTGFMATVEDAIVSRGIANNPLMAGRYRLQATQAAARNMNTQAGVAAQILAYARQTGVISDAEAAGYQEGLVSGDRSRMEDSINRLLVTTFGSKERGRELMQDSMFVNSLRQSMDGRAGAFALNTIIRGSDNEMARRERITLAENRYAFSRSSLLSSGMSTTQSDEGIGLVVDSIVGALNGEEAGVGDMFRAEYERRIASGMKPNEARRATVSSFTRDPVYGKYAETIGIAAKSQATMNNNRRYIADGLQSGQAKDMALAMRRAGVISGEQYGDLMRRIRGGDYSGAIAEVDRINAGLSPEMRKRFSAIRASAETRYNSAVAAIGDQASVDEFIGLARGAGYGGDAVVGAFDKAIGAMRGYMSSDRSSAAFDRFMSGLDASDVRNVFGVDTFNRFRDLMQNGSMIDPATGKTVTADEYVRKLGRVGIQVRQAATQTLKDNGWGLNMSGFWGGGAYSGNNAAMLMARNRLIAEYAGVLQADSVKNAGDRSTLVQDFVSMMESKDWKKLLKMHDSGGKLQNALGGDYLEQFQKVEQLNSAMADTHGAFRDVIKDLGRADKYAQASQLVEMLGKIGDKIGDDYVYSDEQFKDQLEAAGISTSSEKGQRFMAALQAKRDLVTEQNKLKEMGKRAMRGDAFAPAMLGVQANMQAYERDSAARSVKYASIDEYLGGLDLSDESLFTERFGGFNGQRYVKNTALSDAFDSLYGVITDDMISAAYNGATDYSPSAKRRKAFELLKDEVANGNEKAIGVMNKFQTAAKEANAVRIKGNITLQVDGESRAAVLDGEMGTF